MELDKLEELENILVSLIKKKCYIVKII